MKPRIIFVASLTLWSMGKEYGGPAFSQTVQKYSNAGWEVFLVSDVPSNADCPLLDKAHNIVLQETRFKKLGSLRKIGLIARWLDHRIMTRHFLRAVCQIIGSRTEQTVLYAYEVFAVKACKELSERFKLPLVTRFQGTILSGIRNTSVNRIARYPHYQALSTRADLVIMTDDGTQGDRILKELHNSSPHILFLRNGLSLMERDIPSMNAEFNRNSFRAALGISEQETIFLTVSRLVGWKRVDRALNGFADCLKTAPGCRLIIVGDGDDRDNLARKAEELGISDHVVFTGAIPHDEVYSYMMACDVFVSLYDLSNVGNPLLESMTLGKCIVTLDTGDTGKLIENGKNGMLMTHETLPQLGKIFSMLASAPRLRETLGNAAASYAQNHFHSWETRMETELKEISELMESNEKG